MRTNEEIIRLLSQLKDEKGISLSELARRVGMAKSALSRYFNRTREFPLNKINEFAEALDVTPEFILGFDEDVTETSDIVSIFDQLEKPRQNKVYTFAKHELEEQNKVIELDEYRDIKIQSSLSAGTGIIDLDPEYAEDFRYKGEVPEHDLAFRVAGDSMSPFFEDGEIVFVKKVDEPRDGMFAAIMINDEAYIKKLYIEENCFRLVSLNKDYDDIRTEKNDDVKIVGKVIL